MAAFTASGIGLSEPDQGRLNQAMAESEPGFIASGGGVQALVFRGCAAPGCDAGRAVHAIDLASGDVFIGVSDAAGAEALAPNERIEALLRLSSPTRRWDDPAPAPGGGQP
ncbi:MAG: hypothetical protein R3C16_00260 [Hyphomonadaceae bacterium]